MCPLTIGEMVEKWHTKSGSCEPMATRRPAAALCQSTLNSCSPNNNLELNKDRQAKQEDTVSMKKVRQNNESLSSIFCLG